MASVLSEGLSSHRGVDRGRRSRHERERRFCGGCREFGDPDDAGSEGPVSTEPAHHDREGVRHEVHGLMKCDETQPFGPPPPELYAGDGGLRRGGPAQRHGRRHGRPDGRSAAGAIVSLVDGTVKASTARSPRPASWSAGTRWSRCARKAEAIEDARRLMQIHADHWPGSRAAARSGSSPIPIRARPRADPAVGPRSRGGLITGVSDQTTASAIEAVWRLESTRLIAGLVRMVRDVGLAEDLAQDAMVAALTQWPGEGIPATRARG